jgi:hypothetical protein
VLGVAWQQTFEIHKENLLRWQQSFTKYVTEKKHEFLG